MTRTLDDLIYESKIAPWLPPRLLDCHAHVSLREHWAQITPNRLKENWAMEVGTWQSWDQLRETYRTIFPGQEVSVLAFGAPFREVDLAKENAYALAGANNFPERARALCVTRPEWSARVVEDAISAGFLGIKPYPDLAPPHLLDISIYDFVPREHLKVLDELSGVLMLHLPRKARLADPDNTRELLEITDRYPSIKLIVAHIGRAYCLPTAKKGLPPLVEATGIYFDTAANLNSDVFQYTLEMVGPDRLLFGSDLPVMMMRGVREYAGENYINYTDGAYTWNTNRKSRADEATYTYYVYEELMSLIRAFEAAGLGKDAFEKVMYANAADLFGVPVDVDANKAAAK